MTTINEKNILQKYNELIKIEIKEILTENDCKRFLRARKWDIEKAIELTEKWYNWYISPIPGGNGSTPRNILDKPDPKEHIFKRLTPHGNMGIDKHGRPVYWEMTGLISTRFVELIKHITLDELVARHIRQQELSIKRLEYQSKIRGENIEKQICIMNLKDLSYSLDTRALATFHKTLAIDQQYYPERLQYLFMINAPWFFTATWAMVKNWIDPVTADKIKILGSNFIDTLREHIPDDQIPPELGGSHPDFRWQWPWPEDTGISEFQLGYTNTSSSSSATSPNNTDGINNNVNNNEDNSNIDDNDDDDDQDDNEEIVFPLGYIPSFKSSKSPKLSSVPYSLLSYLSITSIDTLFHIDTFHIICCIVSLCICDVYFYFLFSYLWDLTISIVLISIASQIILYYFWSDGLLLYLSKLFELSM